MLSVREIVNIGLQLRAKSGVKVRQPLSELRFKNYDLKEELLEIIKEEVNVKSVKIEETFEADDIKADSSLENICLDLEITPELKLEGQARELIRHIQEMRKEAGYEVDNRIKIWYAEKNPVFLKFGDLIARETLADQVLLKSSAEDTDLEKEIKIGEDVFAVSIKR